MIRSYWRCSECRVVFNSRTAAANHRRGACGDAVATEETWHPIVDPTAVVPFAVEEVEDDGESYRSNCGIPEVDEDSQEEEDEESVDNQEEDESMEDRKLPALTRRLPATKTGKVPGAPVPLPEEEDVLDGTDPDPVAEDRVDSMINRVVGGRNTSIGGELSTRFIDFEINPECLMKRQDVLQQMEMTSAEIRDGMESVYDDAREDEIDDLEEFMEDLMEGKYQNDQHGCSSMLERHRDWLDFKEQKELPLTRTERASLRLLAILDKANVQLHIYDDIVKWIKSEMTGAVDTGETEALNLVETDLPARETLTQRMIMRYDLANLKPVEKEVYLPGFKRIVDITCHDFQDALRSLLEDEDLMQEANLLLDDTADPTIFDDSEPTDYNDINTGSVYRQGYVEYVKEGGVQNKVLVPIIIFIDGTVIDHLSRNRLEPVNFTLGIFNAETRKRKDAWRNLGYLKVPDPTLGRPATDEEIEENEFWAKIDDHPTTNNAHIPPKRRDYHAMLYAVMESLRSTQKMGGVFWQFEYKGLKNDEVLLLKVPVLFIMGDTEGHNKICGLVGGHTKNNLCRYCDCKKEDTDDPDVKYEYIGSKQLRVWMDSGEEGCTYVRKTLGFYCLRHNGFDGIDFCDSDRGLNGACPPEILHFYQLGYYVYGLCGFGTCKRRMAAVKNTEVATTIQVGPNGEQYETYNQDEKTAMSEKTTTQNVFTKTTIPKAEYELKRIGSILANQSDRDLPRTKFQSYMPTIDGKNRVSTGKKCGSEMAGVLLCIQVFLCSTGGRKLLLDKMGNDGISDWVVVFDFLLTMEQWMKKELFTENDIDRTRKALPAIMWKYSDVLAREAGEGMCIIKFHLLLHAIEDIYRFGSLCNTNSAIGENNHKFNTKADARRTQRIQDLLDFQTATRSITRMALRMGAAEVRRDYVANDAALKKKQSTRAIRKGSCLEVRWTRDDKDGSVKVTLVPVNTKKTWDSVKNNWGNIVPIARMKQAFAKLIQGITKDGKNLDCKITTFTEYKMETDSSKMFRAHPYWKQKGWHDWCLAQTTVGGVSHSTACHLLCFYEVQVVNDTSSLASNYWNGKYALAHTTIRKDLFGERNEGKEYTYYGTSHAIDLNPNATFLVWDAKQTREQDEGKTTEAAMNGRRGRRVVKIVDLSTITDTLMGVHDPLSSVPNTYTFVEPRRLWEKRFRSYVLYVLRTAQKDRDEEKQKKIDAIAKAEAKKKLAEQREQKKLLRAEAKRERELALSKKRKPYKRRRR